MLAASGFFEEAKAANALLPVGGAEVRAAGTEGLLGGWVVGSKAHEHVITGFR